jgi:hypothetical protein
MVRARVARPQRSHPAERPGARPRERRPRRAGDARLARRPRRSQGHRRPGPTTGRRAHDAAGSRVRGGWGASSRAASPRNWIAPATSASRRTSGPCTSRSWTSGSAATRAACCRAARSSPASRSTTAGQHALDVNARRQRWPVVALVAVMAGGTLGAAVGAGARSSRSPCAKPRAPGARPRHGRGAPAGRTPLPRACRPARRRPPDRAPSPASRPRSPRRPGRRPHRCPPRRPRRPRRRPPRRRRSTAAAAQRSPSTR